MSTPKFIYRFDSWKSLAGTNRTRLQILNLAVKAFQSRAHWLIRPKQLKVMLILEKFNFESQQQLQFLPWLIEDCDNKVKQSYLLPRCPSSQGKYSYVAVAVFFV